MLQVHQVTASGPPTALAPDSIPANPASPLPNPLPHLKSHHLTAQLSTSQHIPSQLVKIPSHLHRIPPRPLRCHPSHSKPPPHTEGGWFGSRCALAAAQAAATLAAGSLNETCRVAGSNGMSQEKKEWKSLGGGMRPVLFGLRSKNAWVQRVSRIQGDGELG